MASVRRERLFEEYRKRKDKADSNFKRSFFMLIIPFGGLWLLLTAYYFIKGLALLAGADMVLGQYFANMITGRNDPLPLTYQTPYLLMFYLCAVSLLAILNKTFRQKVFNYILIGVYVASFIYGLICLFAAILPIWQSVLLMVQAFYGFWCCDVITRCYKEDKFLSLQEGYPEFNVLLGEPVPIANTRGVYMRQYEQMREESRKRAAEKKDINSEGCVDVNEYLTESGTEGIPEDAMGELNTDFGESIDELLKRAK